MKEIPSDIEMLSQTNQPKRREIGEIILELQADDLLGYYFSLHELLEDDTAGVIRKEIEDVRQALEEDYGMPMDIFDEQNMPEKFLLEHARQVD